MNKATAAITVNREKMSGDYSDIALIDQELYVIEYKRNGEEVRRAHMGPARNRTEFASAINRLASLV